jgi:putative addiction module component (TIGR02574 family)
MTALAEKIYDEALDLPANERLGLIDKLLESITPAVRSIQGAWLAEAEKRLQDYRTGKVQAVPGEEVFRKIQNRLSK